jgi:hypothetical protein
MKEEESESGEIKSKERNNRQRRKQGGERKSKNIGGEQHRAAAKIWRHRWRHRIKRENLAIIEDISEGVAASACGISGRRF